MNRLLRIANNVTIPKEVYRSLENVKIKNPETGNTIKWSTAYSYDRKSRAYQEAAKMLQEAMKQSELKEEKGREKALKFDSKEGFSKWMRENYSVGELSVVENANLSVYTGTGYRGVNSALRSDDRDLAAFKMFAVGNRVRDRLIDEYMVSESVKDGNKEKWKKRFKEVKEEIRDDVRATVESECKAEEDIKKNKQLWYINYDEDFDECMERALWRTHNKAQEKMEKEFDDKYKKEAEILYEDIGSMEDELNSAIDKTKPLSHDLIVYRGFDNNIGKQMVNAVGGEFIDNGFVSTSAIRDIAEQFSGDSPVLDEFKKGKFLAEIKVPKGTKVMCPTCVETAITSDEGEMLFGSRNTFRVISAKKVEGNTVIQCEFVSNANNSGKQSG